MDKTQDVVGKVGLLRPCAQALCGAARGGQKILQQSSAIVMSLGIIRWLSCPMMPAPALKAEATPFSFPRCPRWSIRGTHLCSGEAVASQPAWEYQSEWNYLCEVDYKEEAATPRTYRAQRRSFYSQRKSYLDLWRGKYWEKEMNDQTTGSSATCTIC